MTVEEVKNKLNEVSSCFCLAKWTSVTLHLESGTTHSCHHPKPHQIPIDEIKKNPAALHNTKFKINEREKMFKGERPAECEYCWKIEDLSTNEISDRVLKSAAPWSIDEFDIITQNPLSNIYKPKYLEVSFSNACQFKCSYCSADYSTTWEEELKKYGNYPIRTGVKNNITYEEDNNPYIKAFWDWWPEIKSNLDTFRITGGEPLLSSNTFKVLNSLIESPQPNLTVAINSNLGAPIVLIDKFIKAIHELEYKKCVKEIQVFSSIDAFGARAEYIRHGLKHDYFWDNIKKILKSSEITKITLMCTFNALSITSFTELFANVVKLNNEFRNSSRHRAVLIDIAYLRYPEHQTVKVLPTSYLSKMTATVDYIEKLNTEKINETTFYYDLEFIKAKRLLEWMREPISESKRRSLQVQFYDFFTEHDRRRKTNFLKVFPEMKAFWLECKKKESVSFKNKILKVSKKIFNIYEKFFLSNEYRFIIKMLQPVNKLFNIIIFILFLKPYYFTEYLICVKFRKYFFKNKT